MSRRGPREGTIRRRADGRWEGIIQVGYSAGKRVRKSFYGRTQRDVRDKVNLALHDLDQGMAPGDDRVTVGGFLERWLVDAARPSVRPKTYLTYSQIVRLHLRPELGSIRLSRLTPIEVQRLLNGKFDSGLSARTVGMIHAVLRQALGQAVRWGVIRRNVAGLVQPPQPDRLSDAARETL